MSYNRLNWLRRSLSGQLIVLSLVFLAIVIVYLVVVPTWSYLADRDPLEKTGSYALWKVHEALADDEKDPNLDLITQSEVMAEIAAANPNFRYFVEVGDHRVQFGADPRWRNAIDFGHPDISDEKAVAPDECGISAYWGGTFEDSGAPVEVRYSDCGGVVRYIEIAGIDTPIAHASAVFTTENLETMWDNGYRMLIVAAGVTLIAFLVLWFATRSLRRLIVVADSFDDESALHVLPEDGLPSEIVPLIRAVNQMMHRFHSANEQQSFFLSTAAHEMRTPMAILRNRLEDLPDGVTKDELLGDTRRITTLVDQLLQLMSIRNRSDLNKEVDLVRVAKLVVADRAPLVIAKGIEIELDTQISSLPMLGDENLLQVAVANLIDNAISFSKSGDTLRVRIDRNRRLTVRDQGPGITDAMTATIFEPFAKNPPNRKGHGLGLAIVKAIVSLHGGEVSAGNATQGGAEFSLMF